MRVSTAIIYNGSQHRPSYAPSLMHEQVFPMGFPLLENSREINFAACVRRCVPDEGGLFLIARICVSHGTAFGMNVRVRCTHPRSDPSVCTGITCLQEESLKRGTSNVDWKIEEPIKMDTIRLDKIQFAPYRQYTSIFQTV